MKEIEYTILYCVFVRTFVITFYYGSEAVISYGSGSGSGSGSTRQNFRFRFRFHNTGKGNFEIASAIAHFSHAFKICVYYLKR